jgi:hypothetical protein
MSFCTRALVIWHADRIFSVPHYITLMARVPPPYLSTFINGTIFGKKVIEQKIAF